MAKVPWFKFYPADFLLDLKVDKIPPEAEGLLLRMWCFCHLHGSCPADPEELARRVNRSVAYVLAHRAQCEPFFELREGRLFSPRMEREREASERSRENVKKRWAQKSEPKSKSESKSESDGGNTKVVLPPVKNFPPPPSGAAAVDFSSMENSSSGSTRARESSSRYTERDFLERDLRKIRDAKLWVDGLLQTQPLLDADEIERLVLEHAGITAERYAEVTEYQHGEPLRPRPSGPRGPTGKVTAIS